MQGISLPARNISLLNEPKSPPSNLQASERVVVINALAVTKLIVILGICNRCKSISCSI